MRIVTQLSRPGVELLCSVDITGYNGNVRESPEQWTRFELWKQTVTWNCGNLQLCWFIMGAFQFWHIVSLTCF